jgi:hypothetical protein
MSLGHQADPGQSIDPRLRDIARRDARNIHALLRWVARRTDPDPSWRPRDTPGRQAPPVGLGHPGATRACARTPFLHDPLRERPAPRSSPPRPFDRRSTGSDERLHVEERERLGRLGDDLRPGRSGRPPVESTRPRARSDQQSGRRGEGACDGAGERVARRRCDARGVIHPEKPDHHREEGRSSEPTASRLGFTRVSDDLPVVRRTAWSGMLGVDHRRVGDRTATVRGGT